MADHHARIALVVLSDPIRTRPLAQAAQTVRLLRQSNIRLLPYLAVNFLLPRLVGKVIAGAAGEAAERIPLGRLCQRLGLAVVVARDVNSDTFRSQLVGSGAELIVAFHFDQILAADTIAAVPRGGINVHPGPLPAQRGPVPTIHALLDTPPCFGVTVHRLVPRIDAGPILEQALIDLPAETSALAAARLLHLAALPLLERALADLAAGVAEERATIQLPYCGFPKAALLRRLAGAGRRLADWRDVRRALRLPV